MDAASVIIVFYSISYRKFNSVETTSILVLLSLFKCVIELIYNPGTECKLHAKLCLFMQLHFSSEFMIFMIIRLSKGPRPSKVSKALEILSFWICQILAT